MSNPTSPANRNLDLFKEATVFETGRDVPKNHRVSRCTTCDRHFAWKGSAPRPGCPIDGGSLTTTTRTFRGSFYLLEGELLTIGELQDSGLEKEARWHDEAARRALEAAARYDAIIAAGIPHPRYQDRFIPADQAGREYPQLSVSATDGDGARERAAKEQAKAAKYRTRLAKLAGAMRASAVTEAEVAGEVLFQDDLVTVVRTADTGAIVSLFKAPTTEALVEHAAAWQRNLGAKYGYGQAIRAFGSDGRELCSWEPAPAVAS